MAIATFVAGFSNRPFFRRYQEHGYLNGYIGLFWVTVITLFITLLVAISMLFWDSIFLIHLGVGFFAANLLQVCVLVFISYNIARNSKPSISAEDRKYLKADESQQ